MSPTWYLGPAGDLRALTCPEPNISTDVVRYGGIHQGLSGARVVDVTGHRAEYQFQYTYMEPEEWAWLNALHLRHIPGPYRLLDPMKRNRLTPESSSARLGGGTAHGLTLYGGIASRVWDWPNAAGIGAQSTQWSNRVGTSVVSFDEPVKTTVLSGEAITASVWMKAAANVEAGLYFEWYDKSTLTDISDDTFVPVTTEWTRFSASQLIPANTNGAVFNVWLTDITADVYIAAAQVETGDTATEWELGGGAPVVLLDQLATSSPQFPLTNCTLTLLEA
jgi:hypothetical protein